MWFREQILGDEARSRVPDEYVAQLPHAANPPTLFLPIMKLAQSLAQNASAQDQALLKGLHASSISRERWLDFLQRAWPRLLLWFRWFDRLQAGPVSGSYRWAIQLYAWYLCQLVPVYFQQNVCVRNNRQISDSVY